MNEVLAARFESLRTWLRERGIAAGLITAPVSTFYLCGWSNPSKRFSGLLIPANGEPVLILPTLEKAEALGKSAVQNLRTWNDGEDPFAVLAAEVRAAGGADRPIAVEKEWFPLISYERLAAGLGNDAGAMLGRVHDFSPVISNLREHKSEADLTLMQKAADILNPALDAAMKAIKPGMTELELVAALEKAMAEAGAQGVAFDTHVLFGANGALPHGHPGDRVLTEGEVVLMDFGALYGGYRSDITRTVCLGDWSDEMAKVYDTVLAAHDAAIAAAKPGVAFGEIDRAARKVIEDAGYGEYFVHRTGHGLGLEIHEEPYVTPGNPKKAEVGHVVTIEPGIYLPGVGGVRIEDDIVITENGCRTITSWTTKRLSVR